MALKNPLSIRFAKALKRAYKRGQIRERTGQIVPKPHFTMLYNGIFGPTTDADGRKALMQQEFDKWKGFGVQFPGYVHKAYLEALNGLKSKGFWDNVLDVVIEVTSSPVFSAVVGVATAAIPGVGAVLAPVAVALQRKTTEMVRDARDGNFKAEKLLSATAEIAASGVSAASPAAGELIDKAKQVVATARTVAGSPETKALVRSMTAARRLVVKAQQGDAHAAASITITAEKARAGHEPSLRKLALITAVAKGMKDGHIPKATRAEKKEYGRVAVLKFMRLPAAARLLAKSAASQDAPVAKLTAPPPEDTSFEDENEEYEGEEDEQADMGDEEVGAPYLRMAAPKKVAYHMAPSKPAPAKKVAFRLAPSKPVQGKTARPVLVSPTIAKKLASVSDAKADLAVSLNRITPAMASLVKAVTPETLEKAIDGSASPTESPVAMTAAPTSSASPPPYSPAYTPPDEDEEGEEYEQDDEYEDEDAA